TAATAALATARVRIRVLRLLRLVFGGALVRLPAVVVARRPPASAAPERSPPSGRQGSLPPPLTLSRVGSTNVAPASSLDMRSPASARGAMSCKTTTAHGAKTARTTTR